MQNTLIRFRNTSGREAQTLVTDGAAHLALTTQRPPTDWTTIFLGDVQLVTCVGQKHPLAALAKKKKILPVKEILAHGFVSPNEPFFGRQNPEGSIDSWHDDLHPRRIVFHAESLGVYGDLVAQGLAVGYMPDFLATRLGLVVLKVDGLSFQSKAKVWLSARRAKDIGWLGRFLVDLK